jgi:hypothetical protein
MIAIIVLQIDKRWGSEKRKAKSIWRTLPFRSPQTNNPTRYPQPQTPQQPIPKQYNQMQ